MVEILERVQKASARVLRVDEGDIIPEARFREDLGADSINLVEIAMALEAEFSLELDDDAVTSIVTVADAVRYISERLK